MKCLEKDRTRRYDTGSALAMDLSRHLADEPVVACPPTVAYRLKKLMYRHKLAFATGVAFVLFLIAGMSLSSWLAVAINGLRLEAERNATESLSLALRMSRLAYASDINLAQRALNDYNRGHAIELLQRQVPSLNEADLRGWEWRLLWQASRRDSSIALRGPSPLAVRSLSVSSDGRWVAVGESGWTSLGELVNPLSCGGAKHLCDCAPIVDRTNCQQVRRTSLRISEQSGIRSKKSCELSKVDARTGGCSTRRAFRPAAPKCPRLWQTLTPGVRRRDTPP